jgi:hypothetical protein
MRHQAAKRSPNQSLVSARLGGTRFAPLRYHTTLELSRGLLLANSLSYIMIRTPMPVLTACVVRIVMVDFDFDSNTPGGGE